VLDRGVVLHYHSIDIRIHYSVLRFINNHTSIRLLDAILCVYFSTVYIENADTGKYNTVAIFLKIFGIFILISFIVSTYRLLLLYIFNI